MSAHESDIITLARGGGVAGVRKPRSIRSYPSESDDDVSESSNEHVSEYKDCTVWELNYVPWHVVDDTKRLPPGCSTIDIAIEEPTPSYIRSLETNSYKPHGEGSSSSKKPDGLPERIRINSNWLIRFLNHHVYDGHLAWDPRCGLTVRRPFHPLVYENIKLRTSLEQLEATRKRRVDMDEDEYIGSYWKDPAKDWLIHDAIVEDELSVPELTALIMDCRQLVEFLDTILLPEQERLAAVPDTVRFVDLWYVFPMGSLVYRKGTHSPAQIWKVVHRTSPRRILPAERGSRVEYGTGFQPFIIECFYLDHDGTQFFPVFERFMIYGFEDTQNVHDLPVVPLSVAEDRGMTPTKTALLERSLEFIFYAKAKMSHRAYSGRSLDRDPSGMKLTKITDNEAKNTSCYSERIDSEVIIDFVRALEEISGWQANQPSDESPERRVRFSDQARAGEWDVKIRAEFLNSENSKWRIWNTLDINPNDPNDCLIFPARVFAFVLKSRRWACLQLGRSDDGEQRLKALKQQKEPWAKLQLPEGHVEIVQSLIDSHFSTVSSRKVHFDAVKDKGNGVIILLHGVPGVGKTSTAECAAMSNNRPLLPITCGDLGLMPGEVEEKLKEMFRLAQDWGCIMLLDEADIFLAQRTVTDHQRNALVSVFLRTLEYYEGVLFLTTNRVGVFDEAFKSRIHMTLYYPPLDKMKTKKIWETHISRAKDAGIIAEDPDCRELLSYAEEIFNLQRGPQNGPVWNGRQIRNAFQSAVALAAFHAKADQPVYLKKIYFESVVDVSTKFNKYIWTTKHGQTDSDLNRMHMIRRDDFNDEIVDATTSIPAARTGLRPMQNFGAFPRSTFSQGVQSSPFQLSALQQPQQQQQFQQLRQQQPQFFQQAQQPQYQQQSQFPQQQQFQQQQFQQQQFQQPPGMTGIGSYLPQVGQMPHGNIVPISGGHPPDQQQQSNIQVPTIAAPAQSDMASSSTAV